MSDALWANGCTLTRDGNLVAEIAEFTLPQSVMDLIEVSSHDSEDAIKEFIGGWIDEGSLSFACNLIPSDANGQMALRDDQVNRTVVDYVFTFPNLFGMSLSFPALVQNLQMLAPRTDKGQYAVTLKVAGEVTIGVTASNNLSNLAMSNVTLTPSFAAATYKYVGSGTAATTAVTATFSAGTCKLYRAGVEVATLATTVASAAQSLGSIGDLTEFEIRVTESGKTTKSYKISVGRAS